MFSFGVNALIIFKDGGTLYVTFKDKLKIGTRVMYRRKDDVVRLAVRGEIGPGVLLLEEVEPVTV